MSLINTYVCLSQFLRKLTNKVHNKLIERIKDRIACIEDEQVSVESRRSKQMIDCHNKYYADIAALEAKFKAERAKLDEGFNSKKASIAIVSQAISDDLKRELASMKMELDNLTK